MREITIAVVQFQPTLNEPDENIRRMSDFINKICTEQPVDLVVFPELTTTGHECGLRFTDYARARRQRPLRASSRARPSPPCARRVARPSRPPPGHR